MRALPLVILVIAAVGGATVACSSILGFESEYDVVPPDAGPDSPAAGGNSGQAGAGGGASTGGAAGDGGGASCAHSPCEGGAPLEEGCDPCVTQVCEADAVCCSGAWDILCVQRAQADCDLDCCGEGLCLGLGNSCGACPADCGECNCPHSVCEEGAALDAAGCRQACIAPVCNQLNTCCSNYGWTIDCYALAGEVCPPDPCIAAVCDQMPSCCTTAWTGGCVDLVDTECMAGCDCAHPICQQGDALTDGCEPCVSAICEADAFCCNSTWDGYCVAEVQTICDIACP